MSIEQVNPTDFNYAELLDSLTKAYKGQSNITLSEYDTDAAPVVKVGSVFENNGTQFIVKSVDETPTGYSGITVSTTFYLYWDESDSAFIYSAIAPTWADDKQGWYNGNDRAFFSMYKDSGGTLYQSKNLLLEQNNLAISGTINTGYGDNNVFPPPKFSNHADLYGNYTLPSIDVGQTGYTTCRNMDTVNHGVLLPAGSFFGYAIMSSRISTSFSPSGGGETILAITPDEEALIIYWRSS